MKAPRIHESVFIGPNVTIWGDVTIEEDVVILPGVVMRAELDSLHVGARTNVQDNSVFHVDEGYPMRIGEDVTIGHMVMLHGCTVGDGSLIGIGSVVLNGAEIGPRSLVAAGSLVPEGKAFPGGSLIMGRPARVVRPLTEEELDHLTDARDAYQRFGDMYREEGLG